MDKFGARKRLFAGMGDYARNARKEEMRKKYSTGVPALDAVAESSDETVEGIEMPKMMGGSSKKPDAFSLTIGVGDVASDADKWQRENDEALGMMADESELDDEENKRRGRKLSEE